MRSGIRTWWPILVFVLLAAVHLWKVLLLGEVFVPAQMLGGLAPWSESSPNAEALPWNPLLYDSVGQFYPWRAFAADCLQRGVVPLWNPYQFCGTPFVANGQSAVFYPPNLLHVLLGPKAATGVIALLHLSLSACFMWLLLRGLGLRQGACIVGGICYAFSAWQMAWLHLPTFISASCWLPLVLHLVLKLWQQPTAKTVIGLAIALAMVLLAGHLQIAFYVLLAGVLLVGWRTITDCLKGSWRSAGAGIVRCGMALVLALLLASPQLIPSIELSRLSHRQGAASEQGYAAYTGYAVSPASLTTLLYPEAFGSPADPANPYFGVSSGRMLFNFAEGAWSAGGIGLILGVFALLRRRQSGRLMPYFAGVALLAALMATGTVVDRLFYFWVPGFSQSGSPGRALVLWAFAIAALAALGFEKLTNDEAAPKRTAILTFLLVAAGWAAVFGQTAMREAQRAEVGYSGGGASPQIPLSFALVGLLILGGIASGKWRSRRTAMALAALVCLEMVVVTRDYTPSAQSSRLYGDTALTRRLQADAGHDRIAPINTDWSFRGPQAVLPPNSAMVYHLRDIQGYDSLFSGQYKSFMNQLAGVNGDASPREVGNMVFAKTANEAILRKLGVRLVLRARRPADFSGSPEQALQSEVSELPGAVGRLNLVDGAESDIAKWLEDGETRLKIEVLSDKPVTLRVADQMYPGWTATVDGYPVHIVEDDGIFRTVPLASGRHIVDFRFEPMSFRFGMFLALVACAVISGWAMCIRRTRQSPSAATA